MWGETRVERILGVLLVASTTCCNGIVRDTHEHETSDAAGDRPRGSEHGNESSGGAAPRSDAKPPAAGGASTQAGGGERFPPGSAGAYDAGTGASKDSGADATGGGGAPSTGGSGRGGKTTASGGVTGTGGRAVTGGAGGDTSSGAGGSDCSTGQKSCNGLCTPPAPRVGCGLTGCDPCTLEPPQNGYTTCLNGECVFDCLSGFTKMGNACTGNDAGGRAGSCNVSKCPVCNVVDGPACCTNGGKCGCPAVPWVSQTCVAN